MMKHEMGLGTTLFTSSQKLSSLMSALLVGGIAHLYDYYSIYIGCLVLVILAFSLPFMVNDQPADLEVTTEAEDAVEQKAANA